MSDDTGFLASMILKLVPFGDKAVDPDGKQMSRYPRFSVPDVKRLVQIAAKENECLTP